jgi:hypothetical protein
MRACFFLLTLGTLPAIAQSETNISCIERLEIPTYPKLADMARISGVVISNVLLGFNSTVVSIESKSASGKAHPILLPSVEKAVRASRFKECAGKQVTLIFNFVLERNDTLQETKYAFSYPNQFWIAAPPMMVQP